MIALAVALFYVGSLLILVVALIAARREPNVEEEFASLDVPPPLHPNCRCTLLPVTTDSAPYVSPIVAARRRQLGDPILEDMSIEELIRSSQL